MFFQSNMSMASVESAIQYMWSSENNRLFVRGSITVLLTSCFICLVSAALLMLNEQQIYLFSQIQANQTGVQSYSEVFPLQRGLTKKALI